jgi:hypothetical protein
MKIILMSLLMVFLVACSGRKFEKDYKVVDASSKEIPEWIEEPNEWAEDEDEDDYESYSYYVYETEPKNSRTLSCDVAKARASEKIASEISSFIQSEFAQTMESDQSDDMSEISEYIQSNLAKDVKSTIVGAKIQKTYWEKRKYLKELGAKKDQTRYVCAALIKVSDANLKKSFERAHKILNKKAKGEKAKKQMDAFMKKVQSDYTN